MPGLLSDGSLDETGILAGNESWLFVSLTLPAHIRVKICAIPKR